MSRRLWQFGPGMFAVLLLFFCCVSIPAHAQVPPQPLRVATRIVPPFVFQQDGHLTGFSVDLWNSLAQELHLSSKLDVYPDVEALLSAVKSGKADTGIAAVSITSRREQELEFSQPMFDAGLQILVRNEDGGSSTPSLISVFFSPQVLKLLGFVLLLVLIPAHIVWFVERHHEQGIIETKHYFPGIFKAFWWAAGTLGAQADEMPRSALGRVLAIFWMFSSIIFVSYFTAVVTTSMTVQQLQGGIKGPDDLPGKKVATTAGSTSAEYLRERRIQTLEFPRIQDAYEALLSHKADAVVFDAPVLLYYAAQEGKGKAEVVGTIFRKEYYGLVFAEGNPLRKEINEALLRLKEDGIFDKLYDKWFGNGS